LSFKVSQGNIITLTPALTISDRELAEAFDILERALEETEKTWRSSE